MKRTMPIDCERCGSYNVEWIPGKLGLLHCRECDYTWDNEDEHHLHREPRERKAKEITSDWP